MCGDNMNCTFQGKVPKMITFAVLTAARVDPCLQTPTTVASSRNTPRRDISASRYDPFAGLKY